ncbi:MAG: 3-isopropylmalate dehydrogenase, partial [Thermoproteota archaeon]|nr:3-isopropylmalate dehydrogenase [Thermoproteota archaeon]
PSSILLSTKMMLEWLSDKYDDKNLVIEARRIEDSIVSLLKQDQKTKDIGGKLSTTEFAALVADGMYR